MSANSLAVEPWWGGRPLRLWAARRLFDYSHLQRDKGAGVRPWILQGRELGRGPDNEPLVGRDRPVAWIAHEVIKEAVCTVEEQNLRWVRFAARRPDDFHDDNGTHPHGTEKPPAQDVTKLSRSQVSVATSTDRINYHAWCLDRQKLVNRECRLTPTRRRPWKTDRMTRRR